MLQVETFSRGKILVLLGWHSGFAGGLHATDSNCTLGCKAARTFGQGASERIVAHVQYDHAGKGGRPVISVGSNELKFIVYL